MSYLRFATDLQMTHDQKWEALFGIKRRQPESDISQAHMNLALAIQTVTEEIMVQLATTVKQLTGCSKLVMAGGVALNCVANARIVEAKIFEEVWIQPAAGDAGGAVGAALAAYYLKQEKKKRILRKPDAMQGAYLGPAFSSQKIAQALRKFNMVAEEIGSTDQLLELTAHKIKDGNVVGWFQGRMEFGPRALGNRSILADAANPHIQQRLNAKIKLREGFRPFAPSVRLEEARQYFEWEGLSPYMLMVAPVRRDLRNPPPEGLSFLPLYERLSYARSTIPAVTHLDYSARLHTVSEATNPIFYKLLTVFEAITGCGVLVNTSFNVRGEPIVCTPEDALRCFIQTDMDCLIMGNYVVTKKDQHEANMNSLRIQQQPMPLD